MLVQELLFSDVFVIRLCREIGIGQQAAILDRDGLFQPRRKP